LEAPGSSDTSKFELFSRSAADGVAKWSFSLAMASEFELELKLVSPMELELRSLPQRVDALKLPLQHLCRYPKVFWTPLSHITIRW